VRGRCPRPLDEWAGKRKGTELHGPGSLSHRNLPHGALRKPAPENSRSERGLGLARIEPRLEILPDRFAVREHRLVTGAAGRQLDKAYVVVPLSVAAGVRCSLVKGPQAVALPPSPHVTEHLPDLHGKRNPPKVGHSLFARNAVGQNPLAGLQLHGLQSRPDETKYRWAAIACARAVGPWPYTCRAREPIWKRPRYWPFSAVVRRRDSHQATDRASWQWPRKTPQIATCGVA
jgi:hypothetical protein